MKDAAGIRISVALAAVIAICAAGCSNRAAATAEWVPTATQGRIPSPLFDPTLADSLLEAKDRDRWQKPSQIVGALNIGPGMSVADIGAGAGYLMPYLSRAVGPSGKVYAQEIQEPFIRRLKQRAGGFHNVNVIRGSAADPGLPAGVIDRLVLLTVYHELANPVSFLRKLKSVVRESGTLAIIDFDADRRGEPPAPPGHELAESAVLAEASNAGWELAVRHEFLSSQFFVVFRPAARR